MIGGPPRMVWHTFESLYSLSAADGASRLMRAGNEVHFVFNPTSGSIVQIIPASVAGRGLENHPGGVQTNRQGSVCLQVEVIGYARRPWTADLTEAGRRGLGILMDFARAHGIPDTWPAGPPPRYPARPGTRSARSPFTWLRRAGHYGHSQVPENNHGDPGAVDIRLIASSTAGTIDDRKVGQHYIDEEDEDMRAQVVRVGEGPRRGYWATWFGAADRYAAPIMGPYEEAVDEITALGGIAWEATSEQLEAGFTIVHDPIKPDQAVKVNPRRTPA